MGNKRTKELEEQYRVGAGRYAFSDEEADAYVAEKVEARLVFEEDARTTAMDENKAAAKAAKG